MPRSIDRDEAQRLVHERDAQLVEVLPRAEYEWAHLPGARNIALEDLTPDAARSLDRSRPVIVYCNDFQ